MNEIIEQEDMLFSTDKIQKLQIFAELMASGKSTIPAHLQKNPADCMAITMQAAQWGLNPFSVAQATHIVNGKLGYEAKLISAVVERFTVDGFSFSYYGDWDKFQQNGFVKDFEKGCGVEVTATLKRGGKTHSLKLCMEQAKIRNSPLWTSCPQQQLAYLAVKYWARLYKPGAILGIYSPDELEEQESEQPQKPPMKDITPKATQSGVAGLKSRVVDNNAEAQNTAAESQETPLPSILIANAIEKTNAPVTVKEIEDYLIAEKRIKAGGGLDDKSAWNTKWLERVMADAESLVNYCANSIINLKTTGE